MRPARNIEKIIKKFDVDVNPEKDKDIFDELQKAQAKSKTPKPTFSVIDLWRIIMQKRKAKYVTAVAAIIIVAVTVILSSYSVNPAYAIEHTIEAMHSITSIHAFCTDWDDSKGELWIQINPETGQEEYYYSDQGNLLIVATPQATYYYYKDDNLVRIRNEYVPASDVRISRFFEDLIIWVEQYHGEFDIHSKFDKDLQKKVIMVKVSIPEQKNIGEKEIVVRVDPRSKLPINLQALKCAPDEGVKSVDKLEYNTAIPEGIFEFEIPDGAKVVYGNKNP